MRVFVVLVMLLLVNGCEEIDKNYKIKQDDAKNIVFQHVAFDRRVNNFRILEVAHETGYGDCRENSDYNIMAMAEVTNPTTFKDERTEFHYCVDHETGDIRTGNGAARMLSEIR